MRMFAGGLKRHQIDNIDNANFQVGNMHAAASRRRPESRAWEHRPQQAITTSGSPPWSLLAHSQMPMPAVQCWMADSISSHCRAGCLPATITFT